MTLLVSGKMNRREIWKVFEGGERSVARSIAE